LSDITPGGGDKEDLLEKGAREYINHPRGARLEGNRLVLSSIYDWFREDFGGSEERVKKHLSGFADASLSRELEGFGGRFPTSTIEP
jgi:hypothetical protein